MLEKSLPETEPSTPLNSIAPKFIAMGMKRIEAIGDTQTEVIEKVQEANRHWLERVQSEVVLASEFASKLLTAPSIPAAAEVCREWGGRHMELIAQDSKRALADTQGLIDAGARLLSRGWSPGGHDVA